MLACIHEAKAEFALHILLHPTRNADAAGLCQSFKACRNIDPITKNVAPVDDNVSDIDADAQLDALLLRDLGIALYHPALNISGTPHGIHYAGKLHQHAVTRGFDDPATMLGDLGVN